MNNYSDILEEVLHDLRPYEKQGLDTSSLKLFIKNYKLFLKLSTDALHRESENLSFDDKLKIIKSFLEDKKAFPNIIDVINFANERLWLGFKDQKESRSTTINRIIGRIKSKPELKDKVKQAILDIRNEAMHKRGSRDSKRDIITAETFAKWAEIIKKI